MMLRTNLSACVFRKVVYLEEMAKDPVGTLEGVFSFLGMDFLDEKGEKVGKVDRSELVFCRTRKYRVPDDTSCACDVSILAVMT